ncbi:hypothetical protein [Winogradskyella flava]|uniref:hypothetical protein n=1 Tax=Winogradskyella flava TaxID=1884876 RepID=UPI00248F6850|nr:hypothetical protein [Winogradskyella flava]
MNELELKKLWQVTNDKLEQSFVIQKENIEDITRVKIHNLLSSMKPIKIFTLLIGILWVGIGGIALGSIYLYAFSEANKFFLFSATVQVLLTGIALFFYIYQLITIYQVDMTEPILKAQQKIASLKISTLWVTRILFLQLPVWTTFYWNTSMLENENWFQWIVQGIATLSFSFVAIWLFFNIKYENKDKKWFQLIFNGKEWTPLMKAMKLSEQIDKY